MIPKKANDPTYALRGEPGSTLSEMVRNTMIALIVRGEFPDDHRLYPEQLSEKLGVSITPVREALLQLANEGFIENVQRRGFHVRMPTADQIRDMWQVRQGLEITAGDLAIARLKSGELRPEQLLVLDQLQRAQERDPATIEHTEKLELNGNFHSAIVALSGNALLGSLYEGLRHRVVGTLVQRGSDSWRSRLAGESREHWAIIDALKAADLDRYQKAVKAHITRSLGDALVDVKVKQAGR